MPAMLAGQLGPIGLASLLQLIEAEMLTADLHMDHAEMRFNAGELFEVRCGEETGSSAFQSAFLKETGPFEVRAVDPERLPEGASKSLGPVSMLVMSAFRFVDEWTRVASVALVPEDGATPSGGEAFQTLWPFLNGKRSLKMAVRLAKVSPSDVVDDVLAAQQDGSLVVSESASALPGDLDQLSVEVLSNRGRQALRARDFDTAIVCFETAVALEPENGRLMQNLRRIRVIAEREMS